MPDELLTITGRPATISASFRLPLPDYQRVVEICRRRGETLSSYTARLWQKELELEERGGDDDTAKS